MKVVKRIGLGMAAVLALAVLGMVVYVEASWDRRYELPPPELEVSEDPELIARGKYLVHGPAHCSNCHVGSLDEVRRADAGEDLPLRGGAAFSIPLGDIVMPNLTPDPDTGLGRFSDALVFRMLRHNVRPNGMASMSGAMPFARMADDDLVAIVSYLRTLEPVHHEVPESDWTFLGKAVRVFLPGFEPIAGHSWPAKAPPMEPTVERGEYLARYVANCHACHTESDFVTHQFTGPEFAGGMEFPPMTGGDPDVWTRSPNLTPHPTGVLAAYGSVDAWKARMRLGRTVESSPMHWGPFTRMSDEDLEALWLFFNSLPPVDNEVGPLVFRKSEEDD